MIVANDAAVTIVRGSREKLAGPLLGILAITAGMAYVVHLQGWVLPLALGLSVLLPLSLLLLWRLIVPGVLVIDAQGVAWQGGFPRPWRVAWSDVRRFRVLEAKRTAVVLIDYRDGPSGKGWRPSRRPKSIPGSLELGASMLRDLLQAGLAANAAGEAGGAAVDARAAHETPVKGPRLVVPWVSIDLAILLALIFEAEVSFPVTPEATWRPSIQTLIGFGGSDWTFVVGQGQWYRLLTAPWLHASFSHLLFNCVALLLAGRLLEGTIGRTWFFVVYALGGLTGACLSVVLNGPNVLSTGASGAIMALFATTFVCSLHFPKSGARDRLQMGSLQILIPTLLTLGKGADGHTIDFAAHLGGAIGGAFMGAALLWLWDTSSPDPARPKLARASGTVAAGAMALALVPAWNGYALTKLVTGAQLAMSGGALVKGLSDIKQYLEQNPSDAGGWAQAGSLVFAQGDARSSLPFFDKSVQLNSGRLYSLRSRGIARFYGGDKTGALEDLEAAVLLAPKDAYGVLWLDIVSERLEFGSRLEGAAKLLDTDGKWPSPLVQFYLGTIGKDRLFALARQGTGDIAGQLCEAAFYDAEGRLMKDASADVKAEMSRLGKECPPAFIEAWAARAEAEQAGR